MFKDQGTIGNRHLMAASRWLYRLFVIVILASQPCQATDHTANTDNYIFGVFPYLSAVRLENIYAPVAASLQQATGGQIYFRTASQFKRFFGRLKQQHYDIALIQPFWYVPSVDQFGYLPLARMKEPFTSLIMVPDDSPLQTLEDLRGKVIATPPAFVPVVHMARKALKERGLIPGKDLELRAFKSVDSCFQQVLIGNADACVSPPFAPAVVEEKMHVRLRVILKTPAIPNLTFIVHQRVPEPMREQLRQTILSWHTSREGQQLLQGMKTQGFVPALEEDYAGVRELVKEAKKQ